MTGGTRPRFQNGAWWGYCPCGNQIVFEPSLGKSGRWRHAERDAGLPRCYRAHLGHEDKQLAVASGWPNRPPSTTLEES